MRILMMINSLPMGGAETFFVRLALALAREHDVHVLLLRTQTSDPSLVRRLADANIPVRVAWWSRSRPYRWLYKASLIIQRQWPAFSLVDWLRGWSLRRLQRTHSYHVVNPHLCESERVACHAFADHPVRIVGSDHGEYRSCTSPQIPAFQPIFQRSDVLVCPSHDNLKIAQRFPWSRGRRVVVYLGLDMDRVPAPASPRRDPAAFTFGMVSRGIPEKGWAEALAAFSEARRRSDIPLRLVLVGKSKHLDQLQAQLAPDLAVDVEFAGYQADPAPFVAGFDVGLLPSYFANESLPNVVIEYLAQGKPVIATSVGGIPEMLAVGDACAGVIIGRNDSGRASVAKLADAMVQLAEDSDFRNRCAALALQARERFRMGPCLDQYTAIFRGESTAGCPSSD